MSVSCINFIFTIVCLLVCMLNKQTFLSTAPLSGNIFSLDSNVFALSAYDCGSAYSPDGVGKSEQKNKT